MSEIEYLQKLPDFKIRPEFLQATRNTFQKINAQNNGPRISFWKWLLISISVNTLSLIMIAIYQTTYLSGLNNKVPVEIKFAQNQFQYQQPATIKIYKQNNMELVSELNYIYVNNNEYSASADLEPGYYYAVLVDFQNNSQLNALAVSSLIYR